MQTLKKEVISLIEKMPDKSSVADIMAEIFFKMKVDKGLQELDEGLGIPQEQVEEEFAKWVK
ncbi:MAG: hypothetical protein HZA01_00995 [Nitrospinae bacterium]|nr:hypothetical protein [Nitrospinota bacterium]